MIADQPWAVVALVAVIMGGSSIIAWAHAWRRVNLAKHTHGESEYIRAGFEQIERTTKKDEEGYDLDDED